MSIFSTKGFLWDMFETSKYFMDETWKMTDFFQGSSCSFTQTPEVWPFRCRPGALGWTSICHHAASGAECISEGFEALLLLRGVSGSKGQTFRWSTFFKQSDGTSTYKRYHFF